MAVTSSHVCLLACRGGLHLVSFLVRLSANFRRRQARKSLNFLDKLHDTLRYTAFLGAFGGIFVSVDEGIAAAFGKRKYGVYNCLEPARQLHGAPCPCARWDGCLPAAWAPDKAAIAAVPAAKSYLVTTKCATPVRQHWSQLHLLTAADVEPA